MKLVIAWESEEAREQSGSYGYPYRDRPVARARWKQVKDHPVSGLAVYKATEPKGASPQHDQVKRSKPSTSNEENERGRATSMDTPPGETPVRQLRLEFGQSENDPDQLEFEDSRGDKS